MVLAGHLGQVAAVRSQAGVTTPTGLGCNKDLGHIKDLELHPRGHWGISNEISSGVIQSQL